MKRSSRSIVVGVALGAIVVLLGACGGGDEETTTSGTPTGADFDRAFIDAMVPHHQSAIAMARAAKEAGLSQPELLKVANDILATQQDEIDQMQRWRQEWFGSSTIEPNGVARLGLDESEMGMGMDDADALRNSTDVNTEFAQMMITHHQSAIEMAKLAEDRAERAELRDLAQAIISAQEREIEIMRPHARGMDHG